MSELISYKNKPELKNAFIAEIIKHRKADQILQGTYGKGSNGDWKGCAVGCSVHSLNRLNKTNYSTDDHSVYEKELGIPEWLARLEDTLFEALSVEDAKKWPEQFAKAIPVGADLEPVKWKFCAYLMKENIETVLSLDISDELKKQVVDAIRQVLAVHETAIKTGTWDESARAAAESAAWAAAESVAESARAAAESAAWAAQSAAQSVARAAWAAAESAAESAARAAAYIKHSKQLLKLLKAQT